jgi:hypothetical protein
MAITGSFAQNTKFGMVHLGELRERPRNVGPDWFAILPDPNYKLPARALRVSAYGLQSQNGAIYPSTPATAREGQRGKHKGYGADNGARHKRNLGFFRLSHSSG